jgi:hypothetical protein
MKKLSKLTAAQAPISFTMKAHIAAGLLAVAVVVPSEATTGPYIYVANTAEDTVSKIDVSNNTEVARYATWFTVPGTNSVPVRSYTQGGPCPSRIAKDTAKNAYVLDRFFLDAAGKLHLPVLLKIAAAPGSPTSSGSTVLPMTESGSGNNHIDPGEATDKAIVWAKEIGTPGVMSIPLSSPPTGGDDGAWGRAVCMDPQGFLWVGMFNTMRYYKVDPATGAMIGAAVLTIKGASTHHPYGCQVDSNGKLWSVNAGYTLAEIDTNTGTLIDIYNHGCSSTSKGCGTNYSLSIFNDCTLSPTKVTVYLSDSSGKTYIAFDPQTNTFSNPPLPASQQFSSVAVAVDSQGNIISGAQAAGQIIKVSPSGTLMWNVGPFPNTSTQYIQNIHGMIVDDNDDVWAVDLNGNASSAPNGRVLHYSSSGAFIQAVTVGQKPYTYGNTPPATCTGNTGGGDTGGGCAPVKGEARCLPNGGYSYTFTVTNNSGNDMSQILLTPAQGSTFTLSPQLSNLPSPLHNGQSTTVTTIIGNAKPGDKVCFFVSLMSDNAPCCTTQVCPTLPRCGVIETATPPPPTRQQRPPPPSRRGRRRP